MNLTLLARLRDSREVDRSSLRPSALLKLPLLLLLPPGSPEPPLGCEGVLSLLPEPLLHLHRGTLHLGMFKQAKQGRLITASWHGAGSIHAAAQSQHVHTTGPFGWTTDEL